jgi:hypothetical protein
LPDAAVPALLAAAGAADHGPVAARPDGALGARAACVPGKLPPAPARTGDLGELPSSVAVTETVWGPLVTKVWLPFTTWVVQLMPIKMNL